MVTIGYEWPPTNPTYWELKRVTLDEFKDRFANKKITEKKKVTFEENLGTRANNDELKLEFDDEEFMKKVEEWAGYSNKTKTNANEAKESSVEGNKH